MLAPSIKISTAPFAFLASQPTEEVVEEGELPHMKALRVAQEEQRKRKEAEEPEAEEGPSELPKLPPGFRFLPGKKLKRRGS